MNIQALLRKLKSREYKLKDCPKSYLKDKDFLILCADMLQQDFLQACGDGIINEELEDKAFLCDVITCLNTNALQDARLYTNVIKPRVLYYVEEIKNNNPHVNNSVLKELAQKELNSFVVIIEDALEKRKIVDEYYKLDDEETTKQIVESVFAGSVRIECKEYNIRGKNLDK